MEAKKGIRVIENLRETYFRTCYKSLAYKGRKKEQERGAYHLIGRFVFCGEKIFCEGRKCLQGRMNSRETRDSQPLIMPLEYFQTTQNQVFLFGLFYFIFVFSFEDRSFDVSFSFYYFFIFCFLVWFSVSCFMFVLMFSGIMFQDITTLLLDHKAFKGTVDIFVERYRDMDISVVAGNVSLSHTFLLFIFWSVAGKKYETDGRF